MSKYLRDAGGIEQAGNLVIMVRGLNALNKAAAEAWAEGNELGLNYAWSETHLERTMERFVQGYYRYWLDMGLPVAAYQPTFLREVAKQVILLTSDDNTNHLVAREIKCSLHHDLDKGLAGVRQLVESLKDQPTSHLPANLQEYLEIWSLRLPEDGAILATVRQLVESCTPTVGVGKDCESQRITITRLDYLTLFSPSVVLEAWKRGMLKDSDIHYLLSRDQDRRATTASKLTMALKGWPVSLGVGSSAYNPVYEPWITTHIELAQFLRYLFGEAFYQHQQPLVVRCALSVFHVVVNRLTEAGNVIAAKAFRRRFGLAGESYLAPFVDQARLIIDGGTAELCRDMPRQGKLEQLYYVLTTLVDAIPKVLEEIDNTLTNRNLGL